MNIAFIPARCGSKTIEFKNIKKFVTKPLIYWTALAAQMSEKIDKVVIATDCERIENVVLGFNFTKLEVYRRSKENAQDQSSTEAVMLEYINTSELLPKDNFVLVQATSPFTSVTDINSIILLKESAGYDSLLSCIKQKRFYWNHNGTTVNYDYKNRPRRQDFDGFYMENGALYLNTVENIIKYKNRLSGNIGIYEMPEYTGVEIDEELDWIFAESLNKKLNLLEPEPVFTQQISLFLTDVDGVLTDAGMYYTEKGDELKKFCTYDGMGFKLLKDKGVKTGIITSENRELNKRRAEKLNLDFVFQGVPDKLKKVVELCEKNEITLKQVAYIGDDINDFELLNAVGLAACPKNAHEKIKDIPRIIQLSKKGGEGAVREYIELILNKLYQ